MKHSPASASPKRVSATVTRMFHIPNRTPLRSDQTLPKCPTSPSDTLQCAAPAHLRTTTDLQYDFPQSLFGMDFTFSTRSTSNTSKYQSQINSGYIIRQVWITPFIGSNFQKRPSLSSTYSRLAASCHLWRPPPVKAGITHGNPRDRLPRTTVYKLFRV